MRARSCDPRPSRRRGAARRSAGMVACQVPVAILAPPEGGALLTLEIPDSVWLSALRSSPLPKEGRCVRRLTQIDHDLRVAILAPPEGGALHRGQGTGSHTGWAVAILAPPEGGALPDYLASLKPVRDQLRSSPLPKEGRCPESTRAVAADKP